MLRQCFRARYFFFEAGFLFAACVRAEALTFLISAGVSDLGFLSPFDATGATFADVFSFLANFSFLVRKDDD
jgi:hypothetical protein